MSHRVNFNIFLFVFIYLNDIIIIGDNMIERIFHLKENKTNINTEFIAALTTFMAMSYIIFVNPSVLSQTGMDYGSVYAATIITTVLATLILGLYANVPYASSAGIGLGSLFTYTICGSLGYTWQQALAIVFICGIINLIITFTSIRKRIIRSIPTFLQDAITVGIGLFITYVGLINAGIIEFGASSITNGIANDVVPMVANLTKPEVYLSLIGLVFTSILLVKKVKGAYLKGILFTTVIGIFLGVTKLPDFSNYTILPSISPTILKLDFNGLFSATTGALIVLMTIFTLCISDLFDTIGIFIGTGKKAGIFKIDKNGNMPKRLEKAMIADSCGTVIGSLLGTSNATTYLESSAGIEAGGRTGLTSVFAAILFVLSLFLYPIIKVVPMAAVSPILILIGVSMLENIGSIDWKDLGIAIPAFFVIVMMPLSYSITTGIEFGFIFYSIVSLCNHKGKEVSPIIYIFSVLFIIKYLMMGL